MKKLPLIICLCIVAALVTGSCKKEETNAFPPVPSPPIAAHKAPAISAGGYIKLVLPNDSCVLTGTVITGSGIKSFLWEKVSGPAGFSIEHPDSLITAVHGLQEGTYIFRLTATDSSGLTGSAAVTVDVSSFEVFENDLDMNMDAEYTFHNNAEVCPWDCYYADYTTINSSALLSGSELKVWVYEETDSAANSFNVYYGYTGFRLSSTLFASGPSSFNLKKVIQQGGGTFTGTIQLNSSSALGTWRQDAFRNLPPLTVTGELDTTSRSIKMQIKGKIIF